MFLCAFIFTFCKPQAVVPEDRQLHWPRQQGKGRTPEIRWPAPTRPRTDIFLTQLGDFNSPALNAAARQQHRELLPEAAGKHPREGQTQQRLPGNLQLRRAEAATSAWRVSQSGPQTLGGGRGVCGRFNSHVARQRAPPGSPAVPAEPPPLSPSRSRSPRTHRRPAPYQSLDEWTRPGRAGGALGSAGAHPQWRRGRARPLRVPRHLSRRRRPVPAEQRAANEQRPPHPWRSKQPIGRGVAVARALIGCDSRRGHARPRRSPDWVTGRVEGGGACASRLWRDAVRRARVKTKWRPRYHGGARKR